MVTQREINDEIPAKFPSEDHMYVPENDDRTLVSGSLRASQARVLPGVPGPGKGHGDEFEGCNRRDQ